MEDAVDGHRTTIAQGSARALTEILRYAKTARETLRKTG